jgi:Rieske Fe-S protein
MGTLLSKQRVSRRNFVRLGAAVGLGVVGSSVSSACGALSGSGGAVSGGRTIVRVSEVPLGSARAFRDDYSGERAVLVRLESGRFVAYSVVCTHQGCPVAYRDGELLCPCHGSLFDPAHGGAVVRGPAQEPLQVIEVATEGGKVVRVRRPWWRRMFRS